MGPKLLEALEAVNPALRKSIDFGYLGNPGDDFSAALKVLHYIAAQLWTGYYSADGAIRFLSLPISIKSQRSMMKMQRLQPQMTRLREKYKDNNEQLQKEMVDLYKRNHVNPLGGCAPMALQLPIFIGLYEALLNSIELRHAPFMGWINDLSTPDCLHVPGLPQIPFLHCHGLPVLVLLMGASMFLQQYMTPTTPDPSQQRMMMLTPLIFTIMLINFPAGLALYYFSSNILGVIQQYVLNQRIPTVHSGHMSNIDSIEVDADSVEEATREALAQLSAREDEVAIEVLATPRAGVLGLGARQARVRVTRKSGGGIEPQAARRIKRTECAPDWAGAKSRCLPARASAAKMTASGAGRMNSAPRRSLS